MSTAATAVIDKNLAAYNAHQIEDLMALFAPDAVLFEFPDKPVALPGGARARPHAPAPAPHPLGGVTETHVPRSKEVQPGFRGADRVEVGSLGPVPPAARRALPSSDADDDLPEV